ncbi:hypothetical protein ACLOJK_032955 [Asimina triloba]
MTADSVSRDGAHVINNPMAPAHICSTDDVSPLSRPFAAMRGIVAGMARRGGHSGAFGGKTEAAAHSALSSPRSTHPWLRAAVAFHFHVISCYDASSMGTYHVMSQNWHG